MSPAETPLRPRKRPAFAGAAAAAAAHNVLLALREIEAGMQSRRNIPAHTQAQTLDGLPGRDRGSEEAAALVPAAAWRAADESREWQWAGR